MQAKLRAQHKTTRVVWKHAKKGVYLKAERSAKGAQRRRNGGRTGRWKRLLAVAGKQTAKQARTHQGTELE